MKTSTLQSLIARNANVITSLDAKVGCAQDKAVNFKATGEISLSLQEYKLVDKLKTKLAAAHAIQIELHDEMRSIQLRDQSISRLVAMGLGKLVPANLTSLELADLADAMFDAKRPALQVVA